jgi:hypothetical protein
MSKHRSLGCVAAALIASTVACVTETTPVVESRENPRPEDGATASAGVVTTKQREFDLTFVKDREQFAEHDMAFTGSVGPYAVYVVTGTAPALVGPRVELVREKGLRAMLCAADRYFSEGATGTRVELALTDEDTGEVFVSRQLERVDDGECARPSDDYGEPIEPPDGGDGGDGQADGGDGGEPEAPEPHSAHVEVSFVDPPAIGSVILLRRVAVGIEGGHNDAHVIPRICCEDEDCGLTPGGDEPQAEPQ